MTTYLGIDCGTQGTKALVIDRQGNPLGRGYAKHRIVEKASGAREQDPSWWIAALQSSIRDALKSTQGKDVRAIGISGQQHGLVILDEQMQVIRPAKLWNDTETAPQNAEIVERLGGKQAYFDKLGIVPLTGYTVSKLLWVRENEPENFAKIRHILLPHEYLNFYLTGKLAAEYGDASGTAYFDVRSRQWAREVLDAIDGGSGHLFRALPELVASDSIVGRLLPEIAAELAISPECVVSAGGGDNMMGGIGTGNVVEHVVTISLGTSSTVYSYREQSTQDASGDIAAFCSSSGGWLPLVCTMNSTNVVTQTLGVLGKTVQEIEGALERTPPGADGLIFLPFLNGERTPDLPEARGSLVGIATGNFTPDHLIRAVVEGVTFGILNGLKRILEDEQASKIIVIGGGAKSQAWRHLIADATGATILVPLEEESGCLGAAIQAIHAEAKANGEEVTMNGIVEQCVRFDESKTAAPRQELRKAYADAQALYSKRLHELYGR